MIRLEQIRLDRGLTVPALAELAGVSHKVIYRLEETGRVGHATKLHKIAQVLEVPASELIRPATPPRDEVAA